MREEVRLIQKNRLAKIGFVLRFANVWRRVSNASFFCRCSALLSAIRGCVLSATLQVVNYLVNTPVFFKRVTLLACLLVCSPLAIRAQSKPALSSDQKLGEGLFLKNCAFCHSSHKEESPEAIKSPADNPKNAADGPSIGPSLRGIFKSEKAIPESAVRTFIKQGFPEEMPAFRYELEEKDINNIISYLKTL